MSAPEIGRKKNEPALPTTLPAIRPGTAILVRRHNRVQVGSDPHRSVLVELDLPVSADHVAHLLRAVMARTSRRDIHLHLRRAGLSLDELRQILDRLVAAGIATTDITRAHRNALRVRLYGRGPLAKLLLASLNDAGIVTSHSTRRPPQGFGVANWGANLVILSDFLAPDPSVVRALTRERIPHLLVRVRDGVGLVGPLVLPGLTSCLNCADHHRAALEPEWPLLSAQLQRVSGQADAATVAATAALAHHQLEQLTVALHSGRTATPHELANHVLELHPHPTRVLASYWPPHQLCGCQSVDDPGSGYLDPAPAMGSLPPH